LAAAGAIRLVTEPFRPTLSSGVWVWYVLTMVAGLGVVGWAFGRHRTRRNARVAAKPET
jgi:hypothetical protein